MSRIVRVCPRTFEVDWREDFKAVGVTVPEKTPSLTYTPVNHDPMPFSVEVELNTMRVVKRIVGVIPNCTYQGHIFSWNEFCELIAHGEE